MTAVKHNNRSAHDKGEGGDDNAKKLFNLSTLNAFDDFLGELVNDDDDDDDDDEEEMVQLKDTTATSTRKNPSNNRVKQICHNVIKVLDDSDDESLFSSESVEEFGELEDYEPQYHQTDGALEQMFAAPKPSHKPSVMDGTRKSMTIQKTTSSRKSSRDELSKSEHRGSSSRRRSSNNELDSSSCHTPRTRLSAATQDDKKLKPSSPSEKRGGRRSLATKSSLDSPTKARKSLSPVPSSSRNRLPSKKVDDLSRSEHSTPRFRRNDLYSRSSNSSSKNNAPPRTSSALANTNPKYSMDLGLGTSSGGMRRTGSSCNELSSSSHRTRPTRTGGSRNPRRHGSMTSTHQDDETSSPTSTSSRRSRRRSSSNDRRPTRSRSSRRRTSGTKSTSSRRGTSGDASSRTTSRTQRLHSENELSRSLHVKGSSSSNNNIQGMYGGGGKSSGNGTTTSSSNIRRSQSSADTESMSAVNSRSNRKPTSRQQSSSSKTNSTDIDQLVTKLRRESKTKSSMTRMNATWSLQS